MSHVLVWITATLMLLFGTAFVTKYFLIHNFSVAESEPNKDVMAEIPYGVALLVDPEKEPIKLTPSEIATLKSNPKNEAIEKLVFEQVNKIFQGRLNVTGLTHIGIEEGDIVFDGKLPDINLQDKCSLRIDAFDFFWRGNLVKDSNLTTGFVWQDGEMNLFLEANLDAGLGASSSIRASTGAKLFGKCKRLARKTVHVDLHAVGNAIVKANIRYFHG